MSLQEVTFQYVMPLVVLAKSDFVENKLMICIRLILNNVETTMIMSYMNCVSVNLFNKYHSDCIVEYMNYE